MLETFASEPLKVKRDNLLPADFRMPENIRPTEASENYLMNNGFARVVNLVRPKKRTRLIVKKGIENIPMLLHNISLFYTENKIVFAIDQFGKKYMVENNLSELEHELDETIFFRANRQYIINIDHIKSFKPHERVKLKVDMNSAELNAHSSIIISQENAQAFRKWIYEA
jgi:DNA-binding LytR/AlgR family response regulator